MNCPRCATPKPDPGLCPRCQLVSSSKGTLAGADLRNLDLTNGDLRFADLTKADLRGARLDGAHLQGANLHKVQVAGASLHRAKIEMIYAGIIDDFTGTPDWVPLGQTPSAPAPSAPSDLPRYLVAGNPLLCPLCRSETFQPRTINTHGRGLAFFDLEWLGPTSVALTCTSCHHMLWFAIEPLRRT